MQDEKVSHGILVCDDDMATVDQRVQKFEGKQKELAERLSRLEGQTAIPKAAPNQYLIALLGLAGLALLAFFSWLGYEVNDHGKTLSRIDEQFKSINKSIDSINSQLARLDASNTLRSLSSMSSANFATSLGLLQKVTKLPPEEVKIDQDTLNALSKKLQNTSENSPDYWPVVLQFIQFASSAMTPPGGVPPPGAAYTKVRNNECSGFAHCMVASHQAILLDGGNIPNSVFDHCRIKFTENPVGLAGSQFINCVFEMPVSGTPNPYLKDAAKTLLAGMLLNITFPKS